MKKYTLTGLVTISVYTVVEAESLEAAIMKVEEEDRPIEKAEWNSEEQREECWLSSEFDGTVKEIQEQ